LLPKHPIAEAVCYALGQWEELNVFCSDGAVPIDNNVSEREMKRVVLNRNNKAFQKGAPRKKRIMQDQENFKFGSTSGRQSLTRLIVQGMFFATLALALATGTALWAQTRTLGTPFPVYVANVHNSEIVKVDNSGNQSVFTSGGNLSEPGYLAFSRLSALTSGTACNGTYNGTFKQPQSAGRVTEFRI
jgi:hypothetical protein